MIKPEIWNPINNNNTKLTHSGMPLTFFTQQTKWVSKWVSERYCVINLVLRCALFTALTLGKICFNIYNLAPMNAKLTLIVVHQLCIGISWLLLYFWFHFTMRTDHVFHLKLIFNRFNILINGFIYRVISLNKHCIYLAYTYGKLNSVFLFINNFVHEIINNIFS